VKRSRRAQTVLGDRHDPNVRHSTTNSVGRLRNSPGRIFQRLGTQADSRKHCRIEPLKWATGVVFRHCLPISSRRACESQSAACGTRPAEFFNGWARTQKHEGSEKRSSENLIRQRGQRNDLNPGEFASRAVCAARRSMFEPGGESVRCQNLHEPLLSPPALLQKRLCYSSKAIFKKYRLSLARRHFVIDIHCVRESKRRPVQQTRLRQALTSDRIKERGNPLTFSNSLGESRLGEQFGAGSDE
jgi:hypothetical protein